MVLDAGADANEKFPGGETILMIASRSGNPELVKLLLAHGARVNEKGSGIRRNGADDRRRSQPG